MLLMFECGIRGGVTQAVHKFAAANNTYMGDKFDPNEDTTYLQYLDANNLYGWAMSQPLLTGGFRWLDFRMIDENELHEIGRRIENASEGITLQIEKKVETAGSLNAYIYLIMDAQLNIQSGAYFSAVY